jgi:hypothetical protein
MINVYRKIPAIRLDLESDLATESECHARLSPASATQPNLFVGILTMPPRTSALPNEPSTMSFVSLPPTYDETVDLGSPHAHSHQQAEGAPAASEPLSSRIMGWLGGREDEESTYRSYSYFPHTAADAFPSSGSLRHLRRLA